MSLEIPLVLEIEKRPILYNFHLPEYNRKDSLEKVWTEVAAIVNLSVHECKDKWKNIRSSYVRSLRSHGRKLKKPYYLSQYLQFLLPFLKPTNTDDDAQTYTNETGLQEDLSETLTVKIEPHDDGEQILMDPLHGVIENEQAPLRSNGKHVLKRRRQVAIRHHNVQQRNKIRRQANPVRENNATKYFLLSLLPELDTMDDDQIRLFKIKVMMLIDEIKSDELKVRAELTGSGENARLQKRLINLLLKNLNKGLGDR